MIKELPKASWAKALDGISPGKASAEVTSWLPVEKVKVLFVQDRLAFSISELSHTQTIMQWKVLKLFCAFGYDRSIEVKNLNIYGNDFESWQNAGSFILVVVYSHLM